MTEPRRPRSDLVSFEPEVDDSRGFTIGLWSTETVLFALVLAGFTVLRGQSVAVTVLVACAAMLWFVSVTAIVLRGRLQPRPGIGRRILAVAAVALFAGWLAVFVTLGSVGGLAVARVLAFDAVGLLLGSGALVAAYVGRMFRWGR